MKEMEPQSIKSTQEKQAGRVNESEKPTIDEIQYLKNEIKAVKRELSTGRETTGIFSKVLGSIKLFRK